MMANNDELLREPFIISREEGNDLWMIPIEDCNFSTRTYSVLSRADIKNLYQVALFVMKI